ncbi:MAG: penicillin acylase family protein [Bacteroidales bacterium]|nr:penicillin acylase family protein [Bacteroidales bacterium]
MKILKKILIVFLLVIAAVLIIAFIITNKISKRGLPDYSSDIQIENLNDTVFVYRDSYGIPHIYATNEQDLYKATGYILAQDRMWQMDLLRRVTLGRLSEIFGDDYIEIDVLLRSLRYSEKSYQILKDSEQEIVESLIAFSEGINQYIRNYKGNYPLEFKILGYEPELWEPYQSLNLIGYMAWDLKAGWNEIFLEEIKKKVDSARFIELLPNMDFHKSVVYHQDSHGLMQYCKLKELSKLGSLGVDILFGSNNWAISPVKSKTGAALLANDMHLELNIPGIWYQIHQVIEGKLNVSGLILPGQPLVIVGHNDSIAWGMTNTYADNLDFYEEKINPKNAKQYYLDGKWETFKTHNVTIVSKGKEHKKEFLTNHRGPVVSSAKKITDRVLTIHWLGDEKSNEIRSIYKVNRANNWDDFIDAFADFKSISQNIVYADRSGNIGMKTCAGVPIRKRDLPFGPLPGETGEYEWQGLVPYKELPCEFNPERGYVSSANNRTVDFAYPYHIGTWYSMPYRIDRIREMLNSEDKTDVDYFMKMQNDFHSEFSKLFLQKALPELDTTVDWNKAESKAIGLLKKWDYEMSTSSVAATICEAWAYYCIMNLFKDEMGEDLFFNFMKISKLAKIGLFNVLNSNSSVWVDDITTEKKETFKEIAITAFKQTIENISKNNGDDPENWQWGNIHKITLKHPIGKVDALNKIFKLNRGPYSVGGSYHTVSPYSFPFFKPDEVHHGASHRSIYDLSNWNNCVSVIPTGISGVPSSNYYCNQTKMYISGLYHIDLFSKDLVIQEAKTEMKFIP